MGQHGLHGLPAIGRHLDLQAHRLQQFAGHFLVDGVVLGQQDALAAMVPPQRLLGAQARVRCGA
jgi:hypothetical protein